MTTQNNPVTTQGTDTNLAVQKSSTVSKVKPIGFALLIIAGVGGLVVGAVGACGYFQVGSISQIAIISGGGVGGIAFLVVGIIGMVKSCKKQYTPIEIPQVHPTPTTGQPHSTGVSSTTNGLPASGGGNAQPPGSASSNTQPKPGGGNVQPTGTASSNTQPTQSSNAQPTVTTKPDLVTHFQRVTAPKVKPSEADALKVAKEKIAELTDNEYAKFIEQIEIVSYFVLEKGDLLDGPELDILTAVWSDKRALKLSFDSTYQKIKSKDPSSTAFGLALLKRLNAGTFELLFNCFKNDPSRPEHLLSTLCAHPEFSKNEAANEFVSETYFKKKVKKLEELLPTLDLMMFQTDSLNPYLRIFLVLSASQSPKWFKTHAASILKQFKAALPAVQSKFINLIKDDFFKNIALEFIKDLDLENGTKPLTADKLSVLQTIQSHRAWDFCVFEPLIYLDKQQMCTLLAELPKTRRYSILLKILERYNAEIKAPTQPHLWTNLLEIIKEFLLDGKIKLENKLEYDGIQITPKTDLFKQFIECISHSYVTQIEKKQPNAEQQKVFEFIIKHAGSIAEGANFKQVIWYWSAMEKTALSALLISMPPSMLKASASHILEGYSNKKITNSETLELIKDLFMQGKIKFQPQDNLFQLFIKCISSTYKSQAADPWKPSEEQIKLFEFILTQGADISKTQGFKEALGYWLTMDDKALIQVLKPLIADEHKQKFTILVDQIVDQNISLLEKGDWKPNSDRIDLMAFVVENVKPANKQKMGILADAVLTRYGNEALKDAPELPPWHDFLSVITTLYLKNLIDFKPTEARFKNFIECISFSFRAGEGWKPTQEQTEILDFILKNAVPIANSESFKKVITYLSQMDQEAMTILLDQMDEKLFEAAVDHILAQYEKLPAWGKLVECVKTLYLNPQFKFQPKGSRLETFICSIYKLYSKAGLTAETQNVFEYILKHGSKVAEKQFNDVILNWVILNPNSMAGLDAKLDKETLEKVADHILESYHRASITDSVVWTDALPVVVAWIEKDNFNATTPSGKAMYMQLTKCLATAWLKNNSVFKDELIRMHEALKKVNLANEKLAPVVLEAFKALNLAV